MNRSAIRRFEIPLPPPSEQKRIVELLDQADALRRMRADADAKAQSILPALFTKIFGSIERIPSWTNLNALALGFRYGTSSKSEPEGCVALRIPNVVRGSLLLDDLKRVPVTSREFARLKLRQGDLLFVRTNGNPDYVGRSAVFERTVIAEKGLDPEKIIFASYLIRARLDLTKVEPLFLQAYLNLPEGRRALRERSRTSAGQYNINIEALRAIPIPSVDIERQRSFASKAKYYEQLTSLRVRSRICVEDTFQSIMHRAFSGDLTAQWRKAHEEQLRVEMVERAKAFGCASARLERRSVSC